MTLPRPEISDAFAAVGVRLALGVLSARVRIGEGDEALGRCLETAARKAVATLGEDPPAQRPAIAAARAAYKALGKDPARYRPAAEALLRRARQGKDLARINTVVDVNNVLSLETGLSIGTHDLDALSPPLLCRPGAEGERYEGIGRGEINLARLPLLADAEGPCGCPTSDSARAAVGPATSRVLMVLYGFGGPAGLEPALARAEALLNEHADASGVESALVTGPAGPA